MQEQLITTINAGLLALDAKDNHVVPKENIDVDNFRFFRKDDFEFSAMEHGNFTAAEEGQTKFLRIT